MKLEEGKIYINRKSKEAVEFGYVGQTGKAICCEPGDRGGGMQSCFAIDPQDLTEAPAMGPEHLMDKVFSNVLGCERGEIKREKAEEEIWKALNWYLAERKFRCGT